MHLLLVGRVKLLNLVFFVWLFVFSITIKNSHAVKPTLEEWVARSGGYFLSHSVQTGNLGSVLREKALKPAELILREKKTVEFESAGIGMSRSTLTIPEGFAEQFSQQFRSLLPCQGVAYIKINQTPQGEYQLLWGETPEPGIGTVLFQSDKEKFFRSCISKIYKLIEHLTGKYIYTGNLETTLTEFPEIFTRFAFPIINCGVDYNELLATEGGVSEIPLLRRAYISDDEFQSRFDALRKHVETAKEGLFAAVVQLVDQANDNLITRNISGAYFAYRIAALKFFRDFYDYLKIQKIKSEDQLDECIKEYFEIVRRNFGKTGKLHDVIYFGPNKIYRTYGDVAVLIGNPIGIRNPRFKFGGTDIITKGFVQNDFAYDVIDLTDDSVVILGPRASLVVYKEAYPDLNIIYREDIPAHLLDFFQLRGYLE